MNDIRLTNFYCYAFHNTNSQHCGTREHPYQCDECRQLEKESGNDSQIDTRQEISWYVAS